MSYSRSLHIVRLNPNGAWVEQPWSFSIDTSSIGIGRGPSQEDHPFIKIPGCADPLHAMVKSISTANASWWEIEANTANSICQCDVTWGRPEEYLGEKKSIRLRLGQAVLLQLPTDVLLLVYAGNGDELLEYGRRLRARLQGVS